MIVRTADWNDPVAFCNRAGLGCSPHRQGDHSYICWNFPAGKDVKACPESLKPELFETLCEFVAKNFLFLVSQMSSQRDR
jgi:hypothetical protein